MRISLGITGASGAIYARRLLERLQPGGHTIHVALTRYGWFVWKEELGLSFEEWKETMRWDGQQGSSLLVTDSIEDLNAEPCWGRKEFDAYLVVPCSVKTLSAIASGIADNLITRFADVALKERRPLVLMVRETPLHEMHLERMAALARAGAMILPASPGFYMQPKSVEDLVDFMVDKVISYLPKGLDKRG